MVKIRLRRMGAKKAPFYRIVVADSRFARDGRCIEEIGTYDPLSADKKIVVDAERANYWLANGAQPTDTVRVLLKKALARIRRDPKDERTSDLYCAEPRGKTGRGLCDRAARPTARPCLKCASPTAIWARSSAVRDGSSKRSAS